MLPLTGCNFISFKRYLPTLGMLEWHRNYVSLLPTSLFPRHRRRGVNSTWIQRMLSFPWGDELINSRFTLSQRTTYIDMLRTLTELNNWLNKTTMFYFKWIKIKVQITYVIMYDKYSSYSVLNSHAFTTSAYC